ncbi:hypothetical protein ACHAXA_008392 [Cyclostephanos tholiformis]|uniref:Uncharacterized protein n=1 Tax=Cyclostephanos tholiformis TaxID=382380 RepID=A0ABD3RVU4_9STRA
MDNSQLLERIADLEQELISTKLQLACAKSSIDSLEHQLAITSSALLRATPPPKAAAIVVPTARPFSSSKTGGDETESSCRPRKAMRTLNPSSCASALNLFSEIKDPPRRLSSLDSSDRCDLFLRRSSVLNPNTCASGLNPYAELPSLLSPSMLSQSVSVNAKGSSHDIARLFGNRRPSSSSSLSDRHRVGSRNNVRLGDNRRTNQANRSNQVNSKMNAEWGEFK